MMFWLRRQGGKLNWHVIGNVIGNVLLVMAFLFVFPIICGIIYHEEVLSFLFVMIACLVVGFPLSRIKVKHRMYFARDGLMAVGLCWVVLSIVGALPFWFSGTIPHFIDAFFETVSGFTTTGSSILKEVESLPKCMLFWRSFTHWIGGMGILVFVLAILPKSNDRSMHILRAESPGPVIGKLVPRLRKSAMILYAIYMGMTILEVVLLLLGKMPLFDALCNTFGTAGTGGFSITNQGIGQYHNAYYEWVIGIFMALFGVNFNFYFFCLIHEWKEAFHMEEVQTYFKVIGFSTLFIVINILPLIHGGFIDAVRLAFFQVSSIITTTGYSSCDFNLWPTFSKMILLLLMALGACAGSTGGGIKVSRMIVVVKKIRADIQKTIHPLKVTLITFDGKALDNKVVDQIMSFFCCFILILALCMVLVSLDGFDFETTISACFACIGNIGPGFAMVGPFGNFSAFSDLSKIVLSFAMLIGRLEIFPILIFLAPFIGKGKKYRPTKADQVLLDEKNY